MISSDMAIKDLETVLAALMARLKQEFGAIRGNRPAPEMFENIRVSVYDQSLTVRELGSISVLPPRTIQITLWDVTAVQAVLKAINDAHLGVTATNDGVTIRAALSQLGNERRDELTKLIKKTAEQARIQVRGKREDAMKRVKDAESAKEITQDDVFRAKDKIQKIIDKANTDVESMVDAKLIELGE